jgi:hypothetical protein
MFLPEYLLLNGADAGYQRAPTVSQRPILINAVQVGC